MTDQEPLLASSNKNDVNEQQTADESVQKDVQTYEYKIPRIPAYTACALSHINFYTIPYWISEFLIFIVKDNLVRDGVSAGDWVILFLWLIAQPLSAYLGILSIKQGACTWLSYFLFYIIAGVGSIILTISLMTWASTILFLEWVFSLITLIIQIILFLGTIISFGIQLSPSKVKVE